MDTSVYTYSRKYVRKDGTVRVYNTVKKYQKKKAVTHKPTLDLVKQINKPEHLEEVNKLIKKLLDGDNEPS